MCAEHLWGCLEVENREETPDTTNWIKVVDLIHMAF